MVASQRETKVSRENVLDFITQEKPSSCGQWTAVSLFSGAGLSDLGYELAGFQFVVQAELDKRRAAIGADNFTASKWVVGDVRSTRKKILEAYCSSTSKRLDLLVATPPCQGMSSSNPSRGKRQTPRAKALDDKNRLLLEVIPMALLLKPRIIVAENVRQVLTLNVQYNGFTGTVVDILKETLPDYQVFPHVVNVADYGIPQIRKRALIVAVHSDEPFLAQMMQNSCRPWPTPTHSEKSVGGKQRWVSVRQWLETMNYQPLDAESKDSAHGEHPLHFVPSYGPERYQQISQIPPYSGRSAYDNEVCPTCECQPVELGRVLCPSCNGVMWNRPYVNKEGRPSLIKGFRSSYRRMTANRPAYTVTTNSSHVGSDFKVHPWENRVLSILECADLQTVPRFYNWARARENRTLYLIRNLVGEAFPPYFTYLHGQVLAQVLSLPTSQVVEEYERKTSGTKVFGAVSGQSVAVIAKCEA